MKTQFEVNIQVKDMYQFLLHHAYSTFSGWVGVIVAALVLILAVVSYGDTTTTNTMLYIGVAVVMVIYPFLTYYNKAKTQVQKNTMYAKPLLYEFSETGICVSQEDEQAVVAWEELAKVCETKELYIIYVNRVRAFLLPKRDFAAQKQQVDQLLRQHLDAKKVKIH